jgi:G3E family GTPase
MSLMHQVPVTLLTGFLGAGKTTLLNRILSEEHGQKIAVIENEFGEVGIDSDLLINSEEQIVEMNNGCICCTVRGDLVRILGKLAKSRDLGHINFDRVIIETTGLADPGPAAQTFFAEKDIGEYFSLDAIITVVDAKHAPQQLDEYHEAQEQVGYADRILLSKTDLVTHVQLEELMARLRNINSRAPISIVHFGQTKIVDILDIQSFNLDTILEIEPEFLSDVQHEHDDEVYSFVFRSTVSFVHEKLVNFISALLYLYGKDLLRYKGILYIDGQTERFVFQGVHMLMGSTPGKPWRANETPESVIVFIGRNLPKDIFIEGLKKCLIS